MLTVQSMAFVINGRDSCYSQGIFSLFGDSHKIILLFSVTKL